MSDYNGNSKNSSGFDRNARSQSNLDRLETSIDLRANRKKRSQLRRLHSREFAAAFRFKCQLMLGDKKFPRTAMLTFFERASQNKAFEDKFADSFDEHGVPSKRLSSWKIVDAKTLFKFQKEYIQQRLECVPLLESAENTQIFEFVATMRAEMECSYITAEERAKLSTSDLAKKGELVDWINDNRIEPKAVVTATEEDAIYATSRRKPHWKKGKNGRKVWVN